MPPKLRITLDNRLVLTVEQAADRHGMAASSMRTLISRASLEPDAEIGRKNLYLAATLDAVVKARPGKGNRK